MARKKRQKDDMHCGSAFRAARERRGYTRETIAARADISDRFLASVERDERTPSFGTFIKIVQAIGCSADEIINPPLAVGASDTDDFMRLYSQCSDRDKKLLRALVDKMLDEKHTFDGG